MAPKYFPRADTLFALGTVFVLNTSAMVACYVGLKPYVEDPTQIWWPESSVAGVWTFVITTVMWIVAALTMNSHGGLFDINWHWNIVLFTLLARAVPAASSYDNDRSLVILTLGFLYALRLGYHHFTQNELTHFLFETDWRYEAFKDAFVASKIPWPIGSYLLVYLSQAVMVFFGVAPIFIVHDNYTAPLNHWDAIAAAVVFFALVGEATADIQMSNYRASRKSNPANTAPVMTEGLWKYSRHPNYFFEVSVWAGFAIFAAPTLDPWAISGVVIMLSLFLFYSIDVMDKKLLDGAKKANQTTKVHQLEQYQKTTSPFVPWFPAKVSTN